MQNQDQFRDMELRFEEIEAQLSETETYEDPQQVEKLNQEMNKLEPIVIIYRRLREIERAEVEAQKLLHDRDLKELAEEEIENFHEEQASLQQQLRLLLLPKEINNDKNVIMEIRAGVGGEEAALFAHSLFRMYSMYAERKGWKVEVNSANETELGGLKEISFTVEGKGAYSRLKFESGVHRVQRVPETESGGRVHTSTATVAVLPEMDDVEVKINKEDIKMQVFRSTGAGGQHINKTSSAVRLIHIPTGIVVECQQERSQFENRDKAMKMLASKLYDMEQEKIIGEYSDKRRSQVGTGNRNERIRTYNFPQGRVTDHRIKQSIHNIENFLNGDMDQIIDQLIIAEQAEKLKVSEEKSDN